MIQRDCNDRLIPQAQGQPGHHHAEVAAIVDPGPNLTGDHAARHKVHRSVGRRENEHTAVRLT